MGLKKETVASVEKVSVLKEIPMTQDSGTSAAIERLTTFTQKQSVKNGYTGGQTYKQRDFDAEARGKTRCVQFQSALESPAIAGMKFRTMEEYLVLVKQAADAGVAYTFGEGK